MPGSIAARLEQIDKRYIYILLIVVLAIPFLLPIGLPVPISVGTRKVHNALESLSPGAKVLYCFDTVSAVFPELVPIGVAVLEHLSRKPVKIYAISFIYEEASMAVETLIRPKVDMSKKKYGEDYVNLGFYAGSEAAMAAFAGDVSKLVKKDYYGASVDQIPMMRDVRTAGDFNLLIWMGGSGLPLYLRQFYAPYKILTAAGAQAATYPQFTPYQAAGQIVGIINGLMGAAEYETLLRTRGLGIASADAISLSHVAIIVLIALGNIGYLSRPRTERRKEVG